MIQLFQQVFKLNIALSINEKMYYLRKIPLLKRLVPGNLYGSEAINAVLLVFNYILKVMSALFVQLLFLLVFFVVPGMNRDLTGAPNIMLLFFWVTLFSAFFNNPLFSVSEETYYAVVLMKVDPNKYAIMMFTKMCIQKSILSIVILLLCSFLWGFSWYYCFIYPLFYVSFKTIFAYLLVQLFEKQGVLYSDKMFWGVLSVILMLLIIGGSIFIKRTTGFAIPDVYFLGAGFVFVPVAYICYRQLIQTRAFKRMYKAKLVWEKLVLKADDDTKALQKSVEKSLSITTPTDSTKSGFAYFNSIFFNRHRKILFTSAIRVSMMFIVIFLILICGLWLMPEYRSFVYQNLQLRMTGIFVVMYYINRGNKVVQAMFVNCDRSMLNYRFYRHPSTLISLFVQRLKTLTYVNLVPSVVISLGICLLLAVSSQKLEWQYFILIFAAINSISIFFSAHYLVLYYLLQPYDETLQTKGYLYNFITVGTYLVCYQAFRIEVDLVLFTIVTILFCVGYVVIALIAVFRFAPKTFKIRK